MSQRIGPGNTRKRGHQHHPRNNGTRRRSALEPTAHLNDNPSSRRQQQQQRPAPAVPNLETSNVNVVISAGAVTTPTRVTKSPRVIKSALSVNTITPTSAVRKALSPIQTSDIIDLTDCDDTDDISSKKGVAVEDGGPLYIPSTVEGKDMSLIFRPAAEGSSQSDQEGEDPETEELSRLRCTSERTEVVAEREIRKRGRRCADYPGLAFGSSVFSSDTLMKFSIIRNELHNIMNTQLKRVGWNLN